MPDSEKRSSHTHLAEQSALISAWKLENYDPHIYDTAVLHQNYWEYHNGTYGGAIVGVDDISKEIDDVGYIANMNDEQPVGVFNSVNVEDAIAAGVRVWPIDTRQLPRNRASRKDACDILIAGPLLYF